MPGGFAGVADPSEIDESGAIGKSGGERGGGFAGERRLAHSPRTSERQEVDAAAQHAHNTSQIIGPPDERRRRWRHAWHWCGLARAGRRGGVEGGAVIRGQRERVGQHVDRERLGEPNAALQHAHIVGAVPGARRDLPASDAPLAGRV